MAACNLFGRNAVFVKISKQADWLLALTLGKCRYRRYGFDADDLLDSLRDKVKQYSDGELSHPAGSNNEEYHPMDAIGTEHASNDTSPIKTKGRGGKRVRYYKNHALRKVVHVDMPASGHAHDQISPEVRQIRLSIADRKTIWLHQDDVEWVVRILANQAHRSRPSYAASIVSA